MKKLATLTIALVMVLLVFYQKHHADVPPAQDDGRALSRTHHEFDTGSNAAVDQAIEQQRSDIQVQVQAVVKKVLSDDNNGSRHQRFIVELPSGRTLLVAHNIDLAQRVPDLQAGDSIELFGEYAWNERGGVLHWTHHDPAGRHVAGWIKHNDRIYQ